MEGSVSDLQLLIHRLHHLPRLPPWFLGGTRYGDRNPQVKTASEVYKHEVGSPTHAISGPAQGIRCLGQVQVTGHPRGIWRGAQIHPPRPHILGEDSDGGAGGGA